MPSTNRRRVLAAAASGALASLAGCTLGALGCERRTTLRLDPVDDAAIVAANDRTPSALHPLGTDLVRAAGPGGTATFHGARWTPPDSSIEPFELTTGFRRDHPFVRMDGAYYRIVLERARTARTSVTEYVGRTNPTVNADAQSGDTVAFADLPVHDRRHLLDFMGANAGADQDEFGSFASLWEVGYLQSSHVESSLLVPDPALRYVAYRDWFLELEPQGDAEANRVDYDVSLVHLADDDAGFADAVTRIDGMVLRPADLPADQRDIVERATGDGYSECGEWSRALQGVGRTLAGVRYVRYEGQWYATNTGDWYVPDDER